MGSAGKHGWRFKGDGGSFAVFTTVKKLLNELPLLLRLERGADGFHELQLHHRAGF